MLALSKEVDYSWTVTWTYFVKAFDFAMDFESSLDLVYAAKISSKNGRPAKVDNYITPQCHWSSPDEDVCFHIEILR